MSHASIQTTLERYGHLMPGVRQGEANGPDRLVVGSGGDVSKSGSRQLEGV